VEVIDPAPGHRASEVVKSRRAMRIIADYKKVAIPFGFNRVWKWPELVIP
jgi:hypothetical protein